MDFVQAALLRPQVAFRVSDSQLQLVAGDRERRIEQLEPAAAWHTARRRIAQSHRPCDALSAAFAK